MDYTEYLIWKGAIICALAFAGNFVYSFITGRSITQVRTDKASEPTNPEGPQA